MEITSEFSLPLGPDEAYRLLLDLERVAPCLPGATLGSATEDGSRGLTLTVRLGPMRFAYDGTISVGSQDAVARRAVLVGGARERRGQGTANATISMQVSRNGDVGSTIASVANIELTGRAAQTGRGIVEDVSRQMIDELAKCLAARYSEEGAQSGFPPPRDAHDAREIRAARLLARVVWQRIRRLLRRR